MRVLALAFSMEVKYLSKDFHNCKGRSLMGSFNTDLPMLYIATNNQKIK